MVAVRIRRCRKTSEPQNLTPSDGRERKTMKIMTKGLAALVTAFIVLSGTVIGDGVTPLRLIMGEESWVKDYWASSVYYVRASMLQNGNPVGKSAYDYYSVSNFADLCAKVRINATKNAESGLTNAKVNKDLPIMQSIGAADIDMDNPTSFQTVVRFSYAKAGTNYSVPTDVKQATPVLVDNLCVLKRAGVTWANISISDRQGHSITNYDSNLSDVVQVVNGTYVRTTRDIATAGTNSLFLITVYVQENGVFHKFDGNTGLELELNRPKISINKTVEGITVTVNGDAFQGFVVESTSDFQVWQLEGYGMTSESSSTNQWKLVVDRPQEFRFFKVTPIGLSNAQRGHIGR